MALTTRRDLVYTLLAGVFVTNAILGEILGVKLIAVGDYVMPLGILPWPIVFIVTDLVNEYFGRNGVRRLTLMTAGLIAYMFVMIFAAMLIPAVSFSPVNDTMFQAVFGQSLWIIVGSLTAFLISQLVDVFIFWFVRQRTGGKRLWLRATGSTLVSQLIDTFVIQGIAFWLPGKLATSQFLSVAMTSYTYKIVIALATTPAIYLAHAAIDRFIGNRESHHLIEKAAEESLPEPTAI